jgi:CRP-like cAMP-binding protein
MKTARLFEGFSEKALRSIAEAARPAAYAPRKGDIIVHEDCELDFFTMLIKGRVFAEKSGTNGSIELVETYSDGELIGLETVCTPTRKAPFRLVCGTDIEAVVFHYDMMTQDGALPDAIGKKLHMNIIHVLANENIKKLYKIDVLYKRSLRERVMVFLRRLERKTDDGQFSINMDRERFAQYLGVNRSALSKELGRMSGEGLISTHKDVFEICRESPEAEGADQ